MKSAILLVGILAGATPQLGQSMPQPKSCLTSSVVIESPPRYPNADSVGPAAWYVNADRTIWAGPVPEGEWPSGGTLFSGDGVVKGQKTYWVRAQRKQLTITGRRIDTNGPPVEAHIPCCYPTGFQIVALYFPTQGCWEVSAKAGDSELRFVTEVKRSIVDSRQ